jgi:hypothetical protein
VVIIFFAEESEAKRFRLISYMNEDDGGKEVKYDIEKERKRKERLVFFLMSGNLSWLNDTDFHSENLLESLRLSHLRQFMLTILEYSGNALLCCILPYF